MSQYGSIQKNCVVGSGILAPTSVSPLLLDLSDFTRKYDPTEYESASHGGYIYSLDTTAGTLTQPANWVIPPLAVTATNPFQQFNNDIVDGGKYLAMANYLTVKLEGRPQLSNVRVRFQVIQQNMNAVYNSTPNNPQEPLLPDALIHLKNLATFTSGNYLPKKFFRCTFDKTVLMNSASVPSQGAHGTTANIKYVRIPWKPRGGMLVRQRLTAPTSNTGSTTLPEPDRGYFGPDVRNPGQMHWLLISTDENPANTPTLQVTLKSLRIWRDAQGSY